MIKLDVLENNEDADQPGRKRARLDISQETSIKVISKSGTEYNGLVSAWTSAIILFYLCVSLTVDAGVHQSGYLPAAGQHGGQAAGPWGHLSRFSREAGHSDGEKPVDHPGPHGVRVPVWSHSDLRQSTLVRGPQMMAGCFIQHFHSLKLLHH